MSDNAPRYMTRKGLIAFVRERLGVPLSESTLAKKPPKADRFYGNKGLFTEATALAYGASLVTEKPEKIDRRYDAGDRASSD